VDTHLRRFPPLYKTAYQYGEFFCFVSFNFLSDDDKVVIGDADTLLNLCKQAYSLLKSRNSKSIKTSYEQCFHDNVIEKIDSVDTSSAEQLHNALVAA